LGFEVGERLAIRTLSVFPLRSLEERTMPTRHFHISDIITITDGRLVSTRHMDGVYDILNFMTGDNLFTHQLPRAADACKPALLAQHPQLAKLVEPDTQLNGETIPAWLSAQVARFGETLPVAPLAEWESRDPMRELQEMAPDKGVVVVVTE
jgi:hypothetical protein